MAERQQPIFFVSSPYPRDGSNEILGFAAYSHKILAEKVMHYLEPSFEIEYVADEDELHQAVGNNAD
jgi:hypothetical protein